MFLLGQGNFVDSFLVGAEALLAKQERMLLPVNEYELDAFLKKCFQDLDLDCVIDHSILKNYTLLKVDNHSSGPENLNRESREDSITNDFSKCLFGSEIKLAIKLESPIDLFITPQDLSKY